MSDTLYMPVVKGGSSGEVVLECGEMQKILGLLSLMNSSGRARSLTMHGILTKVAYERVFDMAMRGYVEHRNPDGKFPNQLVREAGYNLVSGYADQANNIESIAGGGDGSVEQIWASWMSSEPHMWHLTGTDPFYENHVHCGIGLVYRANSSHGWYWCVLTAPREV